MEINIKKLKNDLENIKSLTKKEKYIYETKLSSLNSGKMFSIYYIYIYTNHVDQIIYLFYFYFFFLNTLVCIELENKFDIKKFNKWIDRVNKIKENVIFKE